MSTRPEGFLNFGQNPVNGANFPVNSIFMYFAVGLNKCSPVCPVILLKSKSDKVRQTDCRAEILLGMCVESHLDKPLDSERDFTMEIGSQKEICQICGY